MHCLMLFLALLSALTLAHSANINARDESLVLIYCSDKDFRGFCDYGGFDRCTPLIMVTRSLSVQEGYQCTLYAGPECRVNDNVSPHYVGDKYVRKTIYDVDFRIMSVICRPASWTSIRTPKINDANHASDIADVKARSDIESPANVKDTADSEHEQTTTVCRDGERKCSRNNSQGVILGCANGTWKIEHICPPRQICFEHPDPRCIGR